MRRLLAERLVLATGVIVILIVCPVRISSRVNVARRVSQALARRNSRLGGSNVA